MSFEEDKLRVGERPDLYSKWMMNSNSPLSRREQALIDALIKNNDETVKWQKYQNDNKQAEENLKSFSKKLKVGVMVPIGSKGLMAGNLIHTNEVFISHYQGIFSKCSVHEALKICEHRSKKAVDHLEKLKVEKDMYENNLNVPHLDGALAEGDQTEIIEEYEEEKEKVWREQHRIRLRNEKQNKKNEIISGKEISHEDIMEKLDNLALMEELENDFNELGIEDDETLRKLMSGEVKTSSKKRISHCSTNENAYVLDNQESNSETNKNLTENILMDKNTYLPEDLTIKSPNDSEDENDTNSEDSSTFDTPKEVMELLKKTKNLNKKEKINLYKTTVKHYEKQIDSLKIVSIADYEEKVRLLEIREYLLDYLEMSFDEIETDTEGKKETNPVTSTIPNQQRRISFATDDQNCFFRQNEVVSEMLKNNQETVATNVKVKKDIIKLDDVEEPEKILTNKLKTIKDRVEKNLQFSQITQSEDDFDLVSKIIKQGIAPNRTLHIQFEHSDSKSNYVTSPEGVIGSLKDTYKLFETNVLPTENVNGVIEPKLAFSTQLNTNKSTDLGKENQKPSSLKSSLNKTDDKYVENKRKSILKNKDLCETNIKKANESKNNIDQRIGFEKIMGDIVEKSAVGPDELPQEQFVDAHAPKKRISHFKKSRCKK